eukprot:4668349-Amphidinium_carterae.1
MEQPHDGKQLNHKLLQTKPSVWWSKLDSKDAYIRFGEAFYILCRTKPGHCCQLRLVLRIFHSTSRMPGHIRSQSEAKHLTDKTRVERLKPRKKMHEEGS